MFESWFWVTAPLGLFALLGFLIYRAGRYPKSQEEGKEEAYTCGEALPEISVRPDNFYQAIKRTLRLRKLRHLQSGNLSDYLVWLLAGLVTVLMLVMYI